MQNGDHTYTCLMKGIMKYLMLGMPSLRGNSMPEQAATCVKFLTSGIHKFFTIKDDGSIDNLTR